MATNASLLMLILTLLGGGGGNHLLDYASTDAYWKSKGVTVGVQTMTNELKTSAAQDITQLIKELASPDGQVRAGASKKIMQLGDTVLPQLEKAAETPDPEVAASIKTLIADISAASKVNSIRRLMAIRTLGELKKPEAVAILRPLVDAKEMFVGEYAARAIAQIESKPYALVGVTAEQRKSDFWLLPADCRVVAQVGTGFPATSIDALIEKMPAAAVGNPNRDQIKTDVTKAIVNVAELVGEVRIDSITFGLAGDIGPNAGFAAVVVRGQYDSAAVRQALAKMQIPGKVVGGVDVFSPEEHFGVMFAGNDRAIGMAGPNAQGLPAEAFATALKTGKGGLADVEAMKKLIASVDTSQALWAVMKMTDTYKQAPVFSAFEQITMVGKLKDQMLDVQISGQGVNAGQVSAAVDQINAGVQMGINQLKPMVQDAPFFSAIIKAMETVQCSSQGEKATLTASIKGDAASLVLPLFFGGMDRSRPAVAPPPVPPAPVEVVK
ncbi:MAG TPA: hypothetical protein VGQ99_07970 [Tepidisphaeraceae bacterium]|jgi:hypothetical protein|nr:hypothetical protein [Tepidisphaeraceae bacterium]